MQPVDSRDNDLYYVEWVDEELEPKEGEAWDPAVHTRYAEEYVDGLENAKRLLDEKVASSPVEWGKVYGTQEVIYPHGVEIEPDRESCYYEY